MVYSGLYYIYIHSMKLMVMNFCIPVCFLVWNRCLSSALRFSCVLMLVFFSVKSKKNYFFCNFSFSSAVPTYGTGYQAHPPPPASYPPAPGSYQAYPAPPSYSQVPPPAGAVAGYQPPPSLPTATHNPAQPDYANTQKSSAPAYGAMQQ